MKKLMALLLVTALGLSLCGMAFADEQKTMTYVGGSDSTTMNLLNKFQAANPDVKIDHVPTETATREQILKTGISSGDPGTVGIYWGTRLNSFYDIGMCLDLRDVIDPELLAKVNPNMQAATIGENGEVWGIPLKTVYHCVFYNKDMMDKYGFEEPTTWAEMTEIMAKLKEDGVFGFATNSASMQDCMYGFVYSLFEEIAPGTAWSVANGDLPVTIDTEVGQAIATVVNQVKEWYDAGYWYPGDGGINTTADDANAAFAQGRCMFIFNYCGAISIHLNDCDFEIGMFMKPVKEAGQVSYENIEPDVLFIPSNASQEQIELGKRFIEYALSQELQQDYVNVCSVPSMDYEYEDVPEILQEILSYLKTDQLKAGINPCRTSPAMQTFIKQQVFAAPCAGIMTVEQMLAEMENIRVSN